MLRDRYDPMDVFERVSTLALRMDPVLAQIDLLFDDTIFHAVKADLLKRFPHTATDGHPSTPVEVILRMLVVKHLHDWSFPQTSQFVADSLMLRQFCRVSFAAVPDQSTLNRWARLIQPVTLHRLLTMWCTLPRSIRLRRAANCGSMVPWSKPTIHHPSDSTLLHDGVRD